MKLNAKTKGTFLKYHHIFTGLTYECACTYMYVLDFLVFGVENLMHLKLKLALKSWWQKIMDTKNVHLWTQHGCNKTYHYQCNCQEELAGSCKHFHLFSTCIECRWFPSDFYYIYMLTYTHTHNYNFKSYS